MLPLPSNLTATRTIVERQLALWPEHESFLARSFAERDAAALEITEDTAKQIALLAADQLDRYCAGYRWMCEAMLQEEIFFRRHGRYQAQSFADVAKAIYDDRRIMRLYMDGLLLSQVFWRNHVDIAGFFRAFIASLPARFELLEIGPGHGLQLAHAALDPKCGAVTAWDVSAASLAATRECLTRLGIGEEARLEQRNIYELGDDTGRFDAVVVSEVLEHLEDPAGALAGVRQCLRPTGRVFLNVPCNSPAPDHIHLFAHPDDFFGMVEGAGFRILDRYITPGTGVTIERALRQKLTVSCAAIGVLDDR